ncbi:AzlD domain-containing protein [Jeotgalibacillus sp. S-D1]|uniref:AzlD domain-containing protein n=1 Tax=Jeotgalibacillus sp. S-D1 TaxID=2552189 RepID=UPI001059F80A|nr:AzlD domain-containing protein [Jeotgalibacillus sp. S-D1]TDL35371.1 AzlD domain-containing protein [Jeotgalibacillus sp. S-D1]
MSMAMFILIIGMAIVTYIPRMLPLTLLEGIELPVFFQSVLRNIPYAVLGALIFPGILLIRQGDLWFGVAGTAAAFAIAWTGANVMIVVMGSIVVLSFYLLVL